MKKLLLLILTLTFSVIPSTDVKAADVNKQAGKAYADIIQQYLTAEKLGEDAFNNPELKDVNPFFIGKHSYYNGGNASYCIKDINSDGIPELFIGEFDICTYHNGKVVHFKSDNWAVPLGERVRYTLCKNGIIEITQGAAAYDYTEYFKLPKNKGNFKSLCYLSISFSMDSHSKASYYKIVNKKNKEISEEKYNKLLKKYRKPVKLTFYDADSKAVDNLRNGIVSYPGQKKIIVKNGFQ